MPMNTPFRFMTRLNLVELLGMKAKNIAELHEGLKRVPGASVYYHTHRFIQQHHYLSPEPPNDFSFWVTHALGAAALGERLACIDTIKFKKIKDLRMCFLGILENALLPTAQKNGDCHEGEEFHFMSCRTFILPTSHEACNLKEFRDIIEIISIDSIYFHFFESRMRLEKGENDFSHWFATIGKEALAREIACLDPYTMTLDNLRKTIVKKVSRYAEDS
jgi:hypothetical protein